MRLRTETFGRVLRPPQRVPTSWTSVAALSIRRTASLVAAVAPYAALRSRVDSTPQLSPDGTILL